MDDQDHSTRVSLGVEQSNIDLEIYGVRLSKEYYIAIRYMGQNLTRITTTYRILLSTSCTYPNLASLDILKKISRTSRNVKSLGV